MCCCFVFSSFWFGLLQYFVLLGPAITQPIGRLSPITTTLKVILLLLLQSLVTFSEQEKNGSIFRDLFNSVSATRPKPVGELQRDIEILMLEVCPKCNTGQLSSQLTCLRFIITTDGVDLNYCIPFLWRESLRRLLSLLCSLWRLVVCASYVVSIYPSILLCIRPCRGLKTFKCDE